MQPNQPGFSPDQSQNYPPQPGGADPYQNSYQNAGQPSAPGNFSQPAQSQYPAQPNQSAQYPAGSNQPAQFSPQPPAAAQTAQPVAPQTNQPQQAQPGPQPVQPASWYPTTQAQAPNDKPSSVDDYLNSARPQPAQPQYQPNQPAGQPAQAAPGQFINGQYAVDYLGGIAPDTQEDTVKIGKMNISKKMLMIGGGMLAALLLALGLLLFTPKPQGISTLNESSFFKSMVATSEITKNAGKNIKNSNLRAINSSLNSQLIGSIQEMKAPLSESGIDGTKLEAEAKKPTEEETAKLQALEDARLNAVYDRAYQREILHRIDTMLVTLDRIDKINSRQSMKDFTSSTRPKLESIKTSLSELTI